MLILQKKSILNLTHGDLEQTTIRNYQSDGSEKKGNSFHQNMATRGIDFLGFTVIDGRVAYESSNDDQKSSRLQALEMEFNASMLQKLIRWTLSQLIIPQNGGILADCFFVEVELNWQPLPNW